ncbi:DMT family transporter [Roseomonas sp. OT10]|uniref:DMT family transporter n=1 Tax=Roseomonas cutis TaxID=2897332 RepID=UPI001E50C8FE|nr:DMT family transporter [Roseomonas sp. OT10]UFN46813.1 DMT family transporter [Roseomonas sp. OT10]
MTPPPAADRLRWADLRLLLLAVVLFGGVWPVTKHALRDATPVWFAVSRAGLATLVITLLVLALGRLRRPGPRDWPAVLAVGSLQLGAFFALTHLALPLVPAGRTAVLSNVTIIWLVPLSVLLLGERLPPRRWAAAGLGLAGAAVLVGPWAVDWSDPRALGGNALLLLAALCWSLAIVITRLRPPHRPMLELLPWCFGLGTLLLAALALLREPGGGIGPGAWPHAAFIGFVAAPLGTWSVIEAGRRLPGAVASVGFMLVPALGLAGAALWLGEPMGWDVWLGAALILGSVLLAVGG